MEDETTIAFWGRFWWAVGISYIVHVGSYAAYILVYSSGLWRACSTYCASEPHRWPAAHAGAVDARDDAARLVHKVEATARVQAALHAIHVLEDDGELLRREGWLASCDFAHDEPQLAEELARRADTFGRHLDLDRFARSWNEDVHAQRARPRVVGTVVRRRVGANLVLLPIR